MSNLVDHAKIELELAGLFDKDSDYGGALGKSILKVVVVFSKAGHSGFSASMSVSILEKLLRFQNLTPLRKEDFVEVSGGWSTKKNPVFQCKRCSEMFLSKDKKGYYSVNDPQKIIKFEKEKK